MIRTMMNQTCKNLYTMQRVMASRGKNYATTKIASLQKAALEEPCILVDNLDRPIGEATKRACHKVDLKRSLLLHRAFSVFLFNGKGDLLLQKRSSNKITFPDYYTNTCCSHPLANIPGETVEENAMGVRRAAIRRLNYELGIPIGDIQPNDFLYLTRIHYKAVSDLNWGEHEIDYILFIQRDNTSIDPNPDEVSDTIWMPRSEVENFVKNLKSPLTPWFRLIMEYKLLYWWDNLNSLDKMRDVDNIISLSMQ